MVKYFFGSEQAWFKIEDKAHLCKLRATSANNPKITL